MKKEKCVKISVLIPEKMKKELEIKAEKLPVNFSTLVRLYLKRGIENT